MVLNARPEPLRDTVDGSFEAWIIEGDQASALAADQMVVVLPAGDDPLKARQSRPHGHALDKSVLDEQIEHAIDARPADSPPIGAEGVLDLDGAQGTGLLGQQPDDPLPRTAAP